MAVKKTTKKNIKEVDPNIKTITCIKCNLPKPALSANYFVSYSPLHANNGGIDNEGKGISLSPICKECTKKLYKEFEKDGLNQRDIVISMCRYFDNPFIDEVYKVTCDTYEGDNFIGVYFKNCHMMQWRKRNVLCFKDSIFENTINENSEDKFVNISNKNNNPSQKELDLLMDKWGDGYTPQEYYLFEKKWNKLKDNYGEKTSFHVEGLITYIRFRVKEELATARGDVKEARDWGALAKDAATSAKINVSQLSKSDISGGIELIPQLFEAVESEVGIISILPKLKEQPMDDADLIIWCIVNYNRRLEDKSRIEYKEIWNFYDEMLEEYYKNQGFNEEQIKIEKKKRNGIFRDLGKVYIEPVYEEGE